MIKQIPEVCRPPAGSKSAQSSTQKHLLEQVSVSRNDIYLDDIFCDVLFQEL